MSMAVAPRPGVVKTVATRSLLAALRRRSQKTVGGLRCLLCTDPLLEPVSLPCRHAFCRACLKDYAASPPPLLPDPHAHSQHCCPICLYKVPSLSSPAEGLHASYKASHHLGAVVPANGRPMSLRCKKHPKSPAFALCGQCREICCQECVARRHANHAGLDDLERRQREMEQQLRATQAALLDSYNTRAACHQQADVLLTLIKEQHKQLEEAVNRQANMLKGQIERQRATLQKQLGGEFERLKALGAKYLSASRYNKQQTEKVMRLTETLVQPEHHADLFVNFEEVQARAEVLMASRRLKLEEKGTVLESHCFEALQRQPKFTKANGLEVGRLSVQQVPLPDVKAPVYTLEDLVVTERRPSAEEVAPDSCRTVNLVYEERESPDLLGELNAPELRPVDALYLPHSEEFVVSEREHQRLTRFAVRGSRDQEVPTKALELPDTMPLAMTYWEACDRIVFTDKRYRSINMVTPDGKELTRLKHDLLRDPFGVGVLSSGKIIGTDTRFKQAKIIDPQTNKVLTVFGDKGDEELQSPLWVTVDRYNRIFITDVGDNSVKLYDINGQYLAKFGHSKKEEERLLCPGKVVTDYNGRLLVAQGNRGTRGSVMMFDAQGQYLKTLLSQQHLSWPTSLALGPQGEMAVVQRAGVVKIFDMYSCKEQED